MYYLNELEYCQDLLQFLRTKFICIIWTIQLASETRRRFLRVFFVCIIWFYWSCLILTTTYSHIPSVLIGKPQPTRPEPMFFVQYLNVFFRNCPQSRVVNGKNKRVETFDRYEYGRWVEVDIIFNVFSYSLWLMV